MRVRLVDIYNTRYFYLSYCKDLTYLFTSYLNMRENKSLQCHAGNDLMKQVFDCAHSNADVEFDLANAKLTTDAIRTVQYYAQRGVLFVDSADAVRNIILQNNRTCASLATNDMVDLPMIKFDQTLKDYLNSLSREVTYTATQVTDEHLLFPLALIILIRRPTIKLNMTHHLPKFMRFVSELLPMDFVLQFDEFFFTTTEGTRTVKVYNGKIATQQRGDISVEEAMTIGYLVPAVLGTRNLSTEPVWDSTMSHCISIVNACKKKKDLFLSEVL